MPNRHDNEIKQFMMELRDIMKAAESINHRTGYRFDPFLFYLGERAENDIRQTDIRLEA